MKRFARKTVDDLLLEGPPDFVDVEARLAPFVPDGFEEARELEVEELLESPRIDLG